MSATTLLLNQARAAQARGDHAAAARGYENILKAEPSNFDAAYLLAVALYQGGQLPRAAEAFAAAVRLKPDFAEAHGNLAVCLAALGRREEALAAQSRAIAAGATSARSWLARAALHEELGRVSEALADVAEALAREPGSIPALLAKAKLLAGQGHHAEAMALCDRAIALDPRNARAYDRAGRVLEAMGGLPAAALSYAKASELEPAAPAPLMRQAAVLAQLARHEEALACYDRLIALQPGKPQHWRARGELRARMGQQAESLDDLGQSLRLTAVGQDAAEAAVEDCIRLLSVDRIPAIYASEEELAATRERVDAVLDDLDRKLADRPPPGPAEIRIAEQAIRHLSGFYLAYHQRNDRETMRKLSAVALRLLRPSPHAPDTCGARQGPIRLGIASQRLRDHNGANWAYNWLARLPRADYAFFTYNFEESGDPVALNFAALGTHRAFNMQSTPQEIITRMRDDRLDVLMLPDVGMTAVSRYLSLHRIAPCQFTAWGHPVTTGSPEIDHYLSSDLMEPADAAEHYTENLVRMPNLALYLEEAEAPPAATRAEFGLPEGRLLYGCLQSLFKYLPRHDAILPRIARQVPDALFVFVEAAKPYFTAVMRERLARAFAAEGLDWARHVVFLPRQTPRGFDRLMQAMDVLIDSIGWSGGNTTLTAIACGVPLATLEGRFMRGRHSSAMFRRIGADEMIAATAEDYVPLLVSLGHDESHRRHCAQLFRAGRHRLYRDEGFISTFDAFLKQQAGAGH